VEVAVLLENLSYIEVEQYLKSKETILIPVGSVEQHSPYGLIGTDFIAAEGVAREVGKRMELLVAPTINYGVSPHHMHFKGSATLSPTTFMNVVMDVALSFVHHGFRRIIFVNGHGGNKSAVETAVQEMKMSGTPGQFILAAWYEGLKETDLVQELFQGQDGSHATPSEVSVTRLLRPDVFDNKITEPRNVETPDYYWPLTSEEMRKVFPDGRMCSAPWLASVEKGRLIMDLAVETLMEKIDAAHRITILE
jgi:creatinine amidohydrolase